MGTGLDERIEPRHFRFIGRTIAEFAEPVFGEVPEVRRPVQGFDKGHDRWREFEEIQQLADSCLGNFQLGGHFGVILDAGTDIKEFLASLGGTDRVCSPVNWACGGWRPVARDYYGFPVPADNMEADRFQEDFWRWCPK